MQPRERQRRRGELRNYSFVAVRLASIVFSFFALFFFAFVSVALGGRVSLPLTLINMPCADLTGTSIATRPFRSLPLYLCNVFLNEETGERLENGRCFGSHSRSPPFCISTTLDPRPSTLLPSLPSLRETYLFVRCAESNQLSFVFK